MVAFPSERRLSPRSDRSLGVSPANRRARLAACEPMHQYSRSARRGACSVGWVTGRPRYSARRAKVGIGGECGNSRAPRADGAVFWAWNRRAEQLARMKCDWAARTTALGTADAAKWVIRQKNRLTQPRATISTSMTAGRCGRPTAEAAERRLEAGVFAAFQSSDGGSVDFAEWVQPGLVLLLGLRGSAFARAVN